MSKSWFSPENKRTLVYQMGLVGGFALLTSTALGFVDRFTRDDIAKRLAEDLEVSLNQVITTPHDTSLLADTLALTGADGKPVVIYRARHEGRVQALAYRVNGAGYGSTTIVIVMGVDATGKILGVRVISHNETPGLGDKIDISKSDWITSFNGRSLGNPPPEAWAVKKEGGVFDQFTGATITPRAVISAVKGGLEFFAANRAELLGEKATAGASPPP